MFVSFLVPVYNVEKYLKECIESLLVQKGCGYEIILLDDGSTDNSGALCDQYKDAFPDIVRVIHKENEGLLATRRRGFKEAKGDWFICVDSDDFIKSDLLEKVVQTIQKYDCDMVMYNYEYLGLDGERTKSRVKLKHESIYTLETKMDIYEKKLCSVDINSMWMRAMKRETVDIDEDYSNYGIRNMCEDAVQILSIYTAAEKIIYLDVPLYVYRKGQESITADVTLDRWTSIFRCASITEKYLSTWQVSEEMYGKYYTRQLEKICDYLRWLMKQDEKMLGKSLNEMIQEIRETEVFANCKRWYNKSYAQTRYLQLTVPTIVYNLEKMNVNVLKMIFLMEKNLNRLRRI